MVSIFVPMRVHVCRHVKHLTQIILFYNASNTSSRAVFMNILQVLPALGSGGVERSTLEIATALRQAGHGAQVASAGGPLVDPIRAMGGICHTLPMASKNPLMWRVTAAALTAIIRDQNIDIVHVRSRAPAFPSRWAVKRAKRWGKTVPLVTTYHGIYNANSTLKRRYNAVMTQADAVIANSSFTRDHIVKEHGLPADAIDVIPRGVELARFPLNISQSRIDAIRTHWGVTPDERVLLLPGRITRWKGQLEAVQAMKNIENLTLVIQGDLQGRDGFMQNLREAASLLPAGKIKFAAPHDDMAASYKASFGVLSASQEPEAFGRITAEACAMGKPVIATAHGGSIEILDGGKLGLMVPPGNIEALNNQIVALADMRPEQAESFAKPAQARARSLFTTEAMRSATLALYSRLLERKN